MEGLLSNWKYFCVIWFGLIGIVMSDPIDITTTIIPDDSYFEIPNAIRLNTSDECIENGFFPYESDCSRFYECKEKIDNSTGVKSYEKYHFKCDPATGTFFDPTSITCVHPWEIHPSSLCYKEPLLLKAVEQADHESTDLDEVTSVEQNHHGGGNHHNNNNHGGNSGNRGHGHGNHAAINNGNLVNNVEDGENYVSSGNSIGQVASCNNNQVGNVVTTNQGGTTGHGGGHLNANAENSGTGGHGGGHHHNSGGNSGHGGGHHHNTGDSETSGHAGGHSGGHHTHGGNAGVSGGEDEDDENDPLARRILQVNNSDECLEEGNQPNENSCRKFIRCVDNGAGGFHRYEFECPLGTIYDTDLSHGRCNHVSPSTHNHRCKS